MQKNPKILLIDIETAPIVALVWGIFDQNIGIDQIVEDWSVLSYTAKWLGNKKLIYNDTSGRGHHKVRDDRKLLKELHALLDEADIVVAQNGKQFDIKKINARLFSRGFKPYSPIRIVDTLLTARSQFGFTSNKLAWQGKIIGSPKDEHRNYPGIELWKECLNDNPRAWAEMEKYNKQDVLSLQDLYLAQRPWTTDHPNVGTYMDGPIPNCPKCGSDHLKRAGIKVLAQGRYQQFQCLDCGGWSRGKDMLNSVQRRKVQLA